MKQKNTLQWLSIVAGKTKLLVGVLVAIQAVLSVSSIAFAFVLRRIINMAVDGVRSGFWASLALLVGILLGQIVLSAAGRFLSEYTSAAVENRFKHRLFSALLTGDYASVAAVHSGEWMNRLTSDTTVVAGGVTQIVPGLIGMLVRLLGAVTAILWLEPRFLYILLPGGAAMMLLTYAFRKILKRLHKRIKNTRAPSFCVSFFLCAGNQDGCPCFFAASILHRRSNVLELFSGFIDLSKCRIGSSRLVL